MNSTTVLRQTTQTGKLFTGQGGMELLSITNHPLRLGSGAPVLGVSAVPQIELLATGDRNVVFKTPVTMNSNLTVTGYSSLGTVDVINYSTGSEVPKNGNDGYRSSGTKLVLYPNLNASSTDYAIGIEPYNMFFTVGDNNNINGYKFYGGTTCVTTISGTGNISSPTGLISSATSATTGNATIGGTLVVTSSISSASSSTTGNATIGGTLTVTGALTTTAFYNAKFYCALLVVSNLMSATVFPGFAQSGVSLNKSATGTYTFTMPAHPRGTQYMVMVQARASSGTTPFFILLMLYLVHNLLYGAKV
jgi:hypothetical protein